MAYIWHAVVSFPSEHLAKEFVGSFDRGMFKLPHAGACELRLGIEKNESGWEVGILPYVERPGLLTGPSAWPGGPDHLNGHGGANTDEEVEDIDACAQVIYERLRGPRLPGYIFAFTGFEVGNWRSPGGLLDDLLPGGLCRKHPFAGIVVSDSMWETADCPHEFFRFCADYMWIPYTTIKNAG